MQHQGEKKIPYTLGKGNNRVDTVERDVKEKYTIEQGEWGKE